ncbi:response regulator transcription factor [Desulfonatronovibrio magnus]|uniref:response regulator transcription factor n=1 Tax=Desulfonatronovibrio magnus TaxID=698827 RepID=UPI000696F967|nr:hypothetical protein [Desulfonatronovibrio magnus]
MKIVLATSRPREFEGFVAGLDLERHEPILAGSAQEVLDFVQEYKPELVIVDESLAQTDIFGLIRHILKLDAMVNTAVITGMDQDEFHQKGEGLGILMSLPLKPGMQEGRELMSRLNQALHSYS